MRRRCRNRRCCVPSFHLATSCHRCYCCEADLLRHLPLHLWLLLRYRGRLRRGLLPSRTHQMQKYSPMRCEPKLRLSCPNLLYLLCFPPGRWSEHASGRGRCP